MSFSRPSTVRPIDHIVIGYLSHLYKSELSFLVIQYKRLEVFKYTHRKRKINYSKRKIFKTHSSRDAIDDQLGSQACTCLFRETQNPSSSSAIIDVERAE